MHVVKWSNAKYEHIIIMPKKPVAATQFKHYNVERDFKSVTNSETLPFIYDYLRRNHKYELTHGSIMLWLFVSRLNLGTDFDAP